MNLYGITIRIDLSWLPGTVLLVWMMAELRFGWLGSDQFGLRWMASVSAALLIFISVLIHVLGHCLAARLVGLRVQEASLLVFGGTTRFGVQSRHPVQELSVALAGPATSLVLALGFYCLVQLPLGLVGLVARHMVMELALANVLLAAFNLLPGLPLDGGHALRAILWAVTGQVIAATRVATWIGIVLAATLVGLGIVLTVNQMVGLHWIYGVGMIVLGLLLLIAAENARRITTFHSALVSYHVKELMHKDGVLLSGAATVAELSEGQHPEWPSDALPVHHDGRLLGMLYRQKIGQIPQHQWADQRLDGLVDAAPVIVHKHDNLLSALQLMQSHRCQALPVLDDAESCVGVITLEQVLAQLDAPADFVGSQFPRDGAG